MSSARLNHGHYQLFALMWALSTVFQLFAMGSYLPLISGNLSALAEAVLFIPALWILWRPSSTKALLWLAALSIIAVVVRAPNIPSHRALAFFVNASILVCFLRPRLETGEAHLRSAFDEFCRCMRVELIFFYCFVVFHKLNSGYFDPTASCGSEFYRVYAQSVSYLPRADWLAHFSLHATLITEAIIPVLLGYAVVRLWGIALALLFHFVLSLHYLQHVMDFTSLMFACLSLFLPTAFIFHARARFEEGHSLYPRRLAVALVLLVLGTIVSSLLPSPDGIAAFWFMRHAFWYTYAGTVILVFLRVGFFSKLRPSRESNFFSIRPAWLWVLPLLLIVNGILPYLGIRNRSSFDMYSSLRMEGGTSNHYLVPAALDLLGNYRDLVQILDTNDETLQQQYLRPGLLITYFEFQSYLSEHPNVAVRYLRAGLEHTVARAGDTPEFQASPPLYLRKLLWYRPVDTAAIARCQW